MKFRYFEDLEVWKKGRELRLFVLDVIKKIPSDEKYALTLQIRKSSRSITNDIAERHGVLSGKHAILPDSERIIDRNS